MSNENDDNQPPQGIIFIIATNNEENDDVDEKGNVKDLIDYSDKDDYKQYKDEIKNKRPKRGASKKNNKNDKEEKNEPPNKKRKVTPPKKKEEPPKEPPPQAPPKPSFPFFLLGGKGVDPRIKEVQDKIINSNMTDKVKETVLSRLKNIDSDKQKHLEWFDSLLKIPFGKYSNLPITINEPINKIQDYFSNAQKHLDDAVYGMEKPKEEIINYIAQFVSTNNNSMPRVIGICGNAGVGKTALIRRGLSDALQRPMRCVSMGGISDASYFNGFDFTYSGSRYGLIVQTLIDSGVMNPIIFMDELDKISNKTDGLDVQNLLVHLTDPVQNNTFQDKYFSGIDIDLSKAILIFSFNDVNLINPILKDRLHIINVQDPDLNAKVIIGRKYLVKEISPNIGLKEEDVTFSEEIMKYLIKEHCENDKGVRNLKRCIETMFLKINTSRFLKNNKYKTLKNLSFPVNITREMIDELLAKDSNPKDEFFRTMFI